MDDFARVVYGALLASAPVGTVLLATEELYGLALRVADVEPGWAITGHSGCRTTDQLCELDSFWEPVCHTDHL
jgi:hypothetical protein